MAGTARVTSAGGSLQPELAWDTSSEQAPQRSLRQLAPSLSPVPTEDRNKRPDILVDVRAATPFLDLSLEALTSALSFTTYLLAKHQDVQDKVREEVKLLLEKDGNINYDNISSLQYLNQVIAEVSKVLSPTARVDKDKLWAELVAELNAIGPAVKDRRRWQHYWTVRVRAAKKKADEFRKNSGVAWHRRCRGHR
ncbi:hypothetical protein HPB47_004449 [Ixodes persulcatus]|uniref:Uncharacterized protein n=1 Tax=Ixodes persulcatus TaxID=34615 RepID=A0AC60PGP0_IXOPE|nr:hypothetical protein HPB47_004449 [Ixodes persulcatus]